ncbi:ribonuclease D [Adhaeribacter pallidiroseus]|uniref:Ribonuclease D n=1 Tax=Adhaeribacter pallidiroseus TaxID=2072847 RepID=A0A369QM14_9BACT|nr:ribonuclease D [Adhaeribacter pallidiroseus]RDC65390.1 Ribonuclease D [Adhaeribacter pallidiroseus]
MGQGLRQTGRFFSYITTETEFIGALTQLAHSPELALDLEFDDNRYTYGLNLCLVQIATREACFLIDPFTIKNLEPLWELIENPAIIKIIHSSTNDILLLKKLGCKPKGVFDTEIAARLLNFLRTSYANILQVIFNIEVDKTNQVSNWNTRPLSEDQLAYAATDVLHLHELKDVLWQDLLNLGRTEWLVEECRLLEDLEIKEQSDRHLKLKGSERLTYFQQHLLKQLFRFRNQLAQQYNRPPAMVIANETLVALALQPASDFKSWQFTKGLMGQLKDNHTFREYQHVLNTAGQEAEDLQLTHQRPFRTRRPELLISSDEAAERRQKIQAVQARIAQEIGENVVNIILPAGMINEYADGKSLEFKKEYARQVVAQTAAALHISL